MAALSAFFKILLRIDSRLVSMAGLIRLLLEHHQSLQQIPVQPVWLDNQDVMQILKISERTLRRRRMEGTIPSTRMGGKFLYKKSDIQTMLGNSI